MLKAQLIRKRTGNQGTFGKLVISSFSCATAELPWLENKSCISCIVAGKYHVVPVIPNNKRLIRGLPHCYHVQDVPGRSGILIHLGNFAGRKDMGYKYNSWGCLLVGHGYGDLYWKNKNGKQVRQEAILRSRFAMSDLIEFVGWNEFDLEIIDFVTGSRHYEKVQ